MTTFGGVIFGANRTRRSRSELLLILKKQMAGNIIDVGDNREASLVAEGGQLTAITDKVITSFRDKFSVELLTPKPDEVLQTFKIQGVGVFEVLIKKELRRAKTYFLSIFPSDKMVDGKRAPWSYPTQKTAKDSIKTDLNRAMRGVYQFDESEAALEAARSGEYRKIRLVE